MKSSHIGPRGNGMDRSAPGTLRIAQIPVEWMNPGSWRLPSGKALAEFALQAGFLAPLLLGDGNAKRWKLNRSAGGSLARRRPASVRESR